MLGRKLQWFLPALLFCFVMSLSAAAADDPDPNSPTPILISHTGSIDALAVPADDALRRGVDRSNARAFSAGDRVAVYVTNLQLMQGEGANAFRVYIVDSAGHQFRFPVVDLKPYPWAKGIYAMTILLNDEIGYWNAPAEGNVQIYVTWRGLASNSLLFGLGSRDGGVRSIRDAVPVPFAGVKRPGNAGRSSASSSADLVGYRWSGDRMRFLEQATFGSNAYLDSRIRRIGPKTWLAEQFDTPYPSPDNPYPNPPLKAANQDDVAAGCGAFLPNTTPEYQLCFRDHYSMYPLQTWFFRESLYGDVQLRHRVAWALSQIWVTSGVDIQQARHMIEYHKILSANAFGNYRDLMRQMTLNPTMGEYLDMVRSTKNNPNENYARELMQLFTIGLFMLDEFGNYQLDGSNNPIPTYDQNVVNDMTKVLTGWTFCSTPGANCPNLALGTVNYIDPVLLNTNNHDLTAKTLLSYTGSTTTSVPACAAPCTSVAARTAYANASLEQALDNIFNHPSLGPYISKLLIQQLVTSDPSPAYIGRVAAIFNNNGFGVRGDLKAVVKAILLDPEARGDVKTDPNYGKLREPVTFATGLLRTFDVRSANGQGQSDGYIFGRNEFVGMGQNPFRSPTVFNYYPPDYVIPGSTLLGPEFAIMTTGTSILRANFVNLMVFNTIPVTANSPNGTSLFFDDMLELATIDPTGGLLMDALNDRMMHGTMSPEMRNTILTAVTSIPATSSTNFLQRAKQAIYLVATSSQYQVQR